LTMKNMQNCAMSDLIYQFFLYKLNSLNSILKVYKERTYPALQLLRSHHVNREQKHYLSLLFQKAQEVERNIILEKQLVINILMDLNPNFHDIYAMSNLVYYFFMDKLSNLDSMVEDYKEKTNFILSMLHCHSALTENQRQLIISLLNQIREVEVRLIQERALILHYI
ncbi:hypothetical protein T09_5207, partial [Trichinella sp. T9]